MVEPERFHLRVLSWVRDDPEPGSAYTNALGEKRVAWRKVEVPRPAEQAPEPTLPNGAGRSAPALRFDSLGALTPGAVSVAVGTLVPAGR